MNKDFELTLLSAGQIWGDKNEKKLEVFRKYGTNAAITDLCILTGSNLYESKLLKSRTGLLWTRTVNSQCNVSIMNNYGSPSNAFRFTRFSTIRPIIQSLYIFLNVHATRTRGYNSISEVELGEYPQWAADSKMQSILETKYNSGMNKTGRSYTFDSAKYDAFAKKFTPVTYEEYEYQGRKYIRIRANSCFDGDKFKLSNCIRYKNGDYVWVEVSPVKWIIDEQTHTLISKYGLVSGIRFLDRDQEYHGDFEKTEMYEYLNKHMIRDLFQNSKLIEINNINQTEINDVKQENKVPNPYNFDYSKVTEEDIIKGAIESRISVFLHGKSSDGKSSRVKDLDSECVILYMRNVSLDSLNGKSVFDSQTGEMNDKKPSWLKKLENICKEEPDKIHILFFDELTNAHPSVQGMAFNIILDREVNGLWKLPDNARIAAAGNDLEDSLSANELSEPLFNRFAHVYINTTTEEWLKWASTENIENQKIDYNIDAKTPKIHPAIYTYIAYKSYSNEEVLRTPYNGKTPNADPRKWEMASKMLYKTNKPEMLRSLVGEDITKDFIEFTKQRIISLEDVLNNNYTEEDINSLNVSEKYATTINLLPVKEEDYLIVNEFINKLGKEFLSMFDSLWIQGSQNRAEIVAETRLEKAKIYKLK